MLTVFLSPESQSLNKEKRALYIKSTIKHNKYDLSVLNAGSATCKHKRYKSCKIPHRRVHQKSAKTKQNNALEDSVSFAQCYTIMPHQKR